jgi:hypothetical protein
VIPSGPAERATTLSVIDDTVEKRPRSVGVMHASLNASRKTDILSIYNAKLITFSYLFLFFRLLPIHSIADGEQWLTMEEVEERVESRN